MIVHLRRRCPVRAVRQSTRGLERRGEFVAAVMPASAPDRFVPLTVIVRGEVARCTKLDVASARRGSRPLEKTETGLRANGSSIYAKPAVAQLRAA